MDITVARARILSNLPDFDSRGFGLGALPLSPNSQHFDLASISEVAEILRTDVPREADLWDYVQLIYNQGGIGACVSYSIAAMQTVFQFIETGWHRELDADECY